MFFFTLLLFCSFVHRGEPIPVYFILDTYICANLGFWRENWFSWLQFYIYFLFFSLFLKTLNYYLIVFLCAERKRYVCLPRLFLVVVFFFIFCALYVATILVRVHCCTHAIDCIFFFLLRFIGLFACIHLVSFTMFFRWTVELILLFFLSC